MTRRGKGNLRTSEMFVSRRGFLVAGAARTVGASLAGGILVFPESARWANAQEKEKDPGSGAADYVLRVGRGRMAPDGRTRDVYTYNGEIPGPVIHAKVGQKLRVKVINELGQPTSVHWHGMHQPGTWQMDGVADVSRPPIPDGQEFTYEFTATPAGTHWYHSHTGVQYSDGLIGPLIVEEERPIAKYDRDVVLLINDWFLKPSEEILAGLVRPGNKDMEKADGKKSAPAGGKGMASTSAGKPDIADVPFESALINGTGRFGADAKAPLTTVEVRPGETLRLRLINGSSTYQFRFQIDGHPLTVIATDGAPMRPVEVDNLLLSPGERYDVLLKATSKYATWIRAITLSGGEARAVLRYSNSQAGELMSTPVVLTKRMLTPDQMKSIGPVKLAAKPQEIKCQLGGTMMPYKWSINEQVYPQADTIKLPANQPVRFVIENPTGMDHPFHLHGHYFHVLGRPDTMNLTDPVQKDTVNVPAKSTLVLQWETVNPGKWFFHCHIEWHLAAGMARVIEIA
jgi:FtsP/CotA-like multicopper oxidase with cupredoxin domain